MMMQKLTPVDLHAEPVVVDAVEENTLKMARKEIQILDYLWSRRGERIGTPEIAERTETPANSCYTYLMRLWEDGIVMKGRKGKLGGNLQWWME